MKYIPISYNRIRFYTNLGQVDKFFAEDLPHEQKYPKHSRLGWSYNYPQNRLKERTKTGRVSAKKFSTQVYPFYSVLKNTAYCLFFSCICIRAAQFVFGKRQIWRFRISRIRIFQNTASIGYTFSQYITRLSYSIKQFTNLYIRRHLMARCNLNISDVKTTA